MKSRPDSSAGSPFPPLARRMRPRNLNEVVGQEHLVGEKGVLRLLAESGEAVSFILWGPPGSGKTTLCHILGRMMGGRMVSLSAVLTGVQELRQVVREAEAAPETRTLVFLDEIHRWNKAQQDALLPYLENGLLVLLGSTTENPSFEIIPPLLSRTRVFVLRPLSPEHIVSLLRAALSDPVRGLGEAGIEAEDTALRALAESSGGDARVALNHLELAAGILTSRPDAGGRLNLEVVQNVLQTRTPRYDRRGEEHYNLVSAFIKSMRGSDPDAAVYWLARMLKAGEEPRFIARRMMILASEDIGNADPRALQVAVAAWQAFECVGMPEGFLPLAHAAIYLAAAPKSNAVYRAYRAAEEEVDRTGDLSVPLHLRNAPTGLMKRMGYGKGYGYDHDFKNAYAGQTHLPDALGGKVFYHPQPRGYERKLGEWLSWLRSTRPAKTPS